MSTRLSTRSKARSVLLSVVVLAAALIAAIPLYYILVSSFKDSVGMAQNPLGLPTTLNLDNYVEAFEGGTLLRAFLNSLLLTVFGVILQVFIGSLAAYASILARTWLTMLMGAILVLTFALPQQVTLIPQYVMFAKVGLTDSLLGLILLYTTSSVFCYFLIVGYMRSLPAELFEAAKMDGAKPFRVYWTIVLPLTRPILTTVIVFQTLSIWNDFLLPNIYLSSPDKQTVPLQVYRAVSQFSTNYPLFMAITVLALLPVLIFFIFAQRWIVSGLLAGAVKG